MESVPLLIISSVRSHKDTGRARIGEFRTIDDLSNLKILIAGCGALGTAVAELLARLGVKELTIVDADVVDITN
ncbi:ThiF family adenylyltransferase, partial [Saccharolobus solfataricus]|uniref:ThiF family adenylyltransferase n=1 Tax=Saccharolobus solfataricus TaxID=2287 RepID=UPI0039058185